MYVKPKEPRFCQICGARLYKDFYLTGRCSKHQTSADADAKLTADAVAAKNKHLSYGQYMAQKKER